MIKKKKSQTVSKVVWKNENGILIEKSSCLCSHFSRRAEKAEDEKDPGGLLWYSFARFLLLSKDHGYQESRPLLFKALI